MTKSASTNSNLPKHTPRQGRRHMAWAIGLLFVAATFFAACQAVPPAATEATTEATVEEAEATEAPTAEAAAEEADATETPAAEEEAEATETPAAEEEGAATDGATVQGDPAAGEYLFTIARGCGCHFNNDLNGYAGGNDFALGEGTTVYAANITSDPTTGIGSYTPAQIATILRTGARPDGSQLHPIMPYRAFSILSDEDALSLGAYLLTLAPIENAVPAREVATEPEPFTPASDPPATAPTDPVARGEYLVQVARCSDCHTPRNEDGTQNTEMFLAGNRINEDEIAWNITPDEETGIGSFPQEELANFLRTGELADGSAVAGTMGTMIERYFSALTADDAMAIAAYLKSLPPIANEPE